MAITPEVAKRPRIGTSKAKFTIARMIATVIAPASRSETMRVSRGRPSSTTSRRARPTAMRATISHHPASTICCQNRPAECASR